MRQLNSTDMLMLDSPRTPNHMGPILICEPTRPSAPYSRFCGRIGPHRVTDAVTIAFTDVKTASRGRR